MVEARSLGPPRYRTFRLQPEVAHWRSRRAESSTAAQAPVLPHRPLVTVGLRSLTRRALLLRAVRAFFVALAFPLLWVLTLISQLSSSCRTFLSLEISFSRLSVWALVCSALSIF